MVKLNYRILPDGYLSPMTLYDQDTLLEHYTAWQYVKVTVTGGKPRSVPENNLFHAACKQAAYMIGDPGWDSTERVKVQCKVPLKFFKDEINVDDHGVHFVLDTLKFDKTNHARSHRFISESLDFLAFKVKLQTEEFIKITKERMGV